MAKVTLTVDAAPEDVWAVLADADSYGEWVVGSDTIRDADAGFPAKGTRFHHRVGVGPLKTNDHTEVLDADPRRKPAWAPGDVPAEARELIGIWWTEGQEILCEWRDGALTMIGRGGAEWRRTVFESTGTDTYRAVRGREAGERMRVVRVDGVFARGDAVIIRGPDGAEVGRGLIAYDAEDAARIRGRSSADILSILGFAGRTEMVHRDDLVMDRL